VLVPMHVLRHCSVLKCTARDVRGGIEVVSRALQGEQCIGEVTFNAESP
jgi:hypothetical protein